MKFTTTTLAGSYLVEPEPFRDGRGWFARFFCKEAFRQIGHEKEWLQLNHSMTQLQGTIRGMHYQKPPFEEIKMVRCITGSIYDVIINLNKGSDTYLQWFGCELSAENQLMLYIPAGFAHGFQTLTDNCQLIYHHTEMYTPGAEGGIRYNDPAIGIRWPLPVAMVSEKDARYPLLDGFKGV